MITMITLRLPKRKCLELCCELIGGWCLKCTGPAQCIYIIGKVIVGSLEFLHCSSGIFHHILPLESVKELDSTPNDQTNFASGHNESKPGGMKTFYSLPVGDGVEDS
jgi:hypothetical protein